MRCYATPVLIECRKLRLSQHRRHVRGPGGIRSASKRNNCPRSVRAPAGRKRATCRGLTPLNHAIKISPARTIPRSCSIVATTIWSGAPAPAPGKLSLSTLSPTSVTPTSPGIWLSGCGRSAARSGIRRPCGGEGSRPAHSSRGGIGLPMLRG